VAPSCVSTSLSSWLLQINFSCDVVAFLQSKLAECAKFTAKNSDNNINIFFIQNNLSNFSEQLTLEWGIRQRIAGLPKNSVSLEALWRKSKSPQDLPRAL
jgi:hypothetical protein